MEAARTSKTLVNFYQTTRRYKTAIFVLTAVRTSNPTYMIIVVQMDITYRISIKHVASL
jgi:hypothetical protein